MITEEMARLKSELYSENGGLGEIQKSLEALKGNPLLGFVYPSRTHTHRHTHTRLQAHTRSCPVFATYAICAVYTYAIYMQYIRYVCARYMLCIRCIRHSHGRLACRAHACRTCVCVCVCIHVCVYCIIALRSLPVGRRRRKRRRKRNIYLYSMLQSDPCIRMGDGATT